MNGNLSFVDFLTILGIWVAIAVIVYFAQPLSSGWLVDLAALIGAYYLSKFIILKKD